MLVMEFPQSWILMPPTSTFQKKTIHKTENDALLFDCYHQLAANINFFWEENSIESYCIAACFH